MFAQIKEFNNIRQPARAYLCYLLNRYIPNKLPDISIDIIQHGLSKLVKDIKEIDVAYILDISGNKIGNNLSKKEIYRTGEGENRSSRAYFYRAVKEKKCIMTEPYPSMVTAKLSVSSSMPVYNEDGNLICVVVIDLSLENIINVVHLQQGDKLFQNFSKIVYTFFSVALFAVATVLFFNGIKSFFQIALVHLDVADMFKSTILLTLSLAIYDLVKTIMEEEVFGKHEISGHIEIHQTMVKFLGSIIIAMGIEALMLVFKFALTMPQNLIYASMLIVSVTILIFGLSYYLKSVNRCDVKDGK